MRPFAVLAVGLFSAACGASGSPAAPSPTPSNGSPGAAIISGSVRSGSSQLATTTGGAPQGLTVSVAGTAISSGIDAGGRFMLSGVPPGDVVLQFRASGLDATVPIAQVRAAETVTLAVNVTGQTVAIEATVRATSGEEELEGRVESLPPTMAAGSLKVAGRTVVTQGSTRIEQGGADRQFGDLQIGMRVHVQATPSGSSVLATLIRIQNTNTWIPVPVNGVIDTPTGTPDLFQFNIGSRVIKGDTLTEFYGGSTFAQLLEGARVEVKGQQRDGYIYAERIHVSGPRADDDDDDDGGGDGQDQSASIHGTLTAMSGGRPNLILTVGGTTVRTSSSTEVQRRGDVQSLAELQIGQSLHVIGDRRADGSIDARRIQIQDDQTGGVVQIEGSVGGLKGTCPAVTFGVNGFDVRTSGATTFQGGPCTALKNGDKVTVDGTRAADGSIAATKISR